MDKKAFAYGILVGGVVGAAAALLSAPLSGKDLRNQVKDSTNDWIKIATDIKDNAVDLKDSVAKLSKEGTEIFKDLASDVKMAVEEWQQDTDPNREALHKEMKEIQQTIARLEQKLHDNKTAT